MIDPAPRQVAERVSQISEEELDILYSPGVAESIRIIGQTYDIPKECLWVLADIVGLTLMRFIKDDVVLARELSERLRLEPSAGGAVAQAIRKEILNPVYAHPESYREVAKGRRPEDLSSERRPEEKGGGIPRVERELEGEGRGLPREGTREEVLQERNQQDFPEARPRRRSNDPYREPIE